MGVPTISFSGYPASYKTTTDLSFYGTFNEAINGLFSNDWVFGHATYVSTTTEIANTKYRVYFTPDGLGDVTFYLKVSGVQSISTSEWNVQSSTITITYQGADTVLTGPTTHSSGALTVAVAFTSPVSGFTISDISTTNCSKTNFITISSGSYTVDLVPSGNSNITVTVPSGVAFTGNAPNAVSNTLTIAGYPVLTPTTHSGGSFNFNLSLPSIVSGFISSDLSITNATLTSFNGSGTLNASGRLFPIYNGRPFSDISITIPSGAFKYSGGIDNNIFSGLIAFDNTSVNDNRPIFTRPDNNYNYIVKPGASGQYTTRYMNVFNKYGTEFELTYWACLPGYSGKTPTFSAWPYTTNGVPVHIQCFADFTQQSMDVTWAVQQYIGGEGPNLIYGKEMDIGKVFIKPDTVLRLNREIFMPNGNVQWAQDTNTFYIKDVWLLSYNNFLYHIVEPKPKFVANQIVFYEADLIKLGKDYSPWDLMFDFEDDPINSSGTSFNAKLLGGYAFPLPGGY
jgi:hypothetical protein